jgi:hypothetical protein
MSDQPPLAAPASAAPDQLASAFRSLLIALGAYGAGKGWFDANIVAAAIPVIMILFPTVWAQFKVRSQHTRLTAAVQVANAATDAARDTGR